MTRHDHVGSALRAVAAATAILPWAFTVEARAHHAPTGWTYDYQCCSGIDCREVPDSAVRRSSKGYIITATGELIPYGDKRIRNSKDEFYHWCSVGGLPDTGTVCLYRPPADF